MDFPFHEIYQLDDYRSIKDPAVFFGMYRYEDSALLEYHDDNAIVFWTGQDVLQWGEDELRFIHRRSDSKTAHPKVYEYLKEKGYVCELVKPSTFLNTINPKKLGPTIYAYCPSSAPDYHGIKIIDELRRAGYEIIIGDGQVPQHLWRHAQKAFYDGIFVGLCLSEFAGGGTSIIEMGLRGIPVITNVFNLPNCYPWRDAQDVANIIEALKVNIGSTRASIARYTWDALDHTHEWLEI
jgi:hypothetical protein